MGQATDDADTLNSGFIFGSRPSTIINHSQHSDCSCPTQSQTENEIISFSTNQNKLAKTEKSCFRG